MRAGLLLACLGKRLRAVQDSPLLVLCPEPFEGKWSFCSRQRLYFLLRPQVYV